MGVIILPSFIISLLALFVQQTEGIDLPPIDLSPSASGKPVLYILGSACFNGYKEHAQTYEPAFQLGLDMVNARDDILPNYELRVVWTDTQCSAGHAVYNMYKELYKPPTKIIFLGSVFSFETEATGLIPHMWNLVQLTPASISPALSNKDIYPLLFRINTPYKAVVPAIIELLNIFKWKRISTLYETKEIFSQVIDAVISLLPENNITLISSEAFSDDPDVQVKNLQKHDTRIIVAGMYERTGAEVFCTAYKIGYYGPKIVWIIPGWFGPQWYKFFLTKNCPPEHVKIASMWAFGLTTTSYNYQNIAGVAGIRPSDFQEQFIREQLGGIYPTKIGMSGPGRCIDSAFTIGYALQYADKKLRESGSPKRLENFTYEDAEMKDLIYWGMRNMSFQGIKGYIKFDKYGDPVGSFKLQQYLSGSVPKDATVRLTELVFVGIGTYMTMCAAATVGAILSVSFLTFNIIYRNKRFIKMSSPLMNDIIVLGSLVAYATIFLQETSNSNVLLLCKLRAYGLMIGFSSAFGALFAKTWRVYMIFTRTTKRTVLKDYQLLLIVAILCLVDVVLIVCRELIDPVSESISTVGIIELDNGDLIITEQSVRCVSNFSLYFKGGVFCIKGILLVFGAFLSWQTRKVTIPALNDSKFIGMSIYNITVLSLLGVVMSFVLTDKVNLSYVFVGGFIIFGTTITQLIIFVPKIVKFKSGKVDDADMNTMGTMNVEVPTQGLSTNMETGMEGQSQELDDTKAFIEQLKKEIEEMKKKKEK